MNKAKPDRVVHHHAQGNNQRAERHALQGDIQDGQHDEGRVDGQQQAGADDDPHAPAAGYGDHHQHDHHHFQQVDEEAVDRLRHEL
ncbi:MAG: hypothetical protein ABF297_10145, partial [Thiogranum sp.]